MLNHPTRPTNIAYLIYVYIYFIYCPCVDMGCFLIWSLVECPCSGGGTEAPSEPSSSKDNHDAAIIVISKKNASLKRKQGHDEASGPASKKRRFGARSTTAQHSVPIDNLWDLKGLDFVCLERLSSTLRRMGTWDAKGIGELTGSPQQAAFFIKEASRDRYGKPEHILQTSATLKAFTHIPPVLVTLLQAQYRHCMVLHVLISCLWHLSHNRLWDVILNGAMRNHVFLFENPVTLCCMLMCCATCLHMLHIVLYVVVWHCVYWFIGVINFVVLVIVVCHFWCRFSIYLVECLL